MAEAVRFFKWGGISTLLLGALAGYAEESYSPYASQTFPANLYWGDTHLHTRLSIDAYMNKNRLSPADAYRFARGETVTTSSGQPARLRRPLDFLVVSDHAINLGVLANLDAENPLLLKTETGKKLYDQLVTERAEADDNTLVSMDLITKLFTDSVIVDKAYRQSLWDAVGKNAETFNQPGKFTAFIGYEWTASTKNAEGSGGSIHRVVIFKDGADKTQQVLPFSTYDSKNPEDLWSYMAGYENKTGGEVLAIPHNSNLSQGQAFATRDFNGVPFSPEYAQMRSRWEPLVEITQMKGDSETHPALSPSDEFADFETWEGYDQNPSKAEYFPCEYVRSALKLGLQQQSELGINPFKFGVIGSTDSHTSLSTADNDNFWGKMAITEPYPTRILDRRYPGQDQWEMSWRLNAAGYAAVWAMENTREALFAAMKRKETYATTGPRMSVRFFGGWNYDKDDAFRPDLARIGYAKGVPMGGDLTAAPKNRSPQFLIHAVKDPEGANLDRVQVVKGWRSKDGKLQEKVYNVVLADNRVVDKNGKAPPIGSTVNIKNASFNNSIGDPELSVVWTDPDFDSAELAFYYLRVLEIPTPRWPAYDAKYFGIKNVPQEIPMTTQERAYTSPIWYTPAK